MSVALARDWMKRWREGNAGGDPVQTLRVLLEELLSLHDHLGRLYWLEKLGAWLREPDRVPPQFKLPGENTRSHRLRFLLGVLREYPAAREAFLDHLRQALLATSGLKLFADAGLPSEYGFVGEASERLLRRILPRPPEESSLSELLERMFVSGEDAHWISHLGPELLMEMARILYFEGNVERNPWRQIRQDMLDALTVLAADVASLGVSKDFLDRLSRGALRDLSFLVLTHACDDVTEAMRQEVPLPPAVLKEHGRNALRAISACRTDVARVVSHLETHGVSVGLVYRVEKVGAILDRLEAILRIVVPQDGLLTVKEIANFAATLVQGVHDDKSLRELVRANLRQLSRKVVERTGETGEHYIVRTRDEYVQMFRAAAGGGVLTLFTTVLKFVIGGLGLPLFFEGLALAFNYAGSFVLMQLVGFKLATKQPAMFAAAIAGKLLERRYLEDSREFVGEVARISRSQIAAVAGNIGLIIPAAVAFDLLWRLVRGHSYLERDVAQYAVSSLDPISSGTIFFAALTGVVLMGSSLVGSWLENFVVYRRIPEAIAKNRRLRHVVGVERAERYAHNFAHGISGIGVSVTLGFLLGLVPVFGKFFGLPLEMRHVTLSTGQMTLGLSALGPASLLTLETLRACIGIVIIGALNFGVSFALGLLLALRAREVSVPSALVLVRDAGRAFIRHPGEFLLPPKRNTPPAVSTNAMGTLTGSSVEETAHASAEAAWANAIAARAAADHAASLAAHAAADAAKLGVNEALSADSGPHTPVHPEPIHTALASNVDHRAATKSKSDERDPEPDVT